MSVIFSISINAQNITGVSTTSPILCNGGQGDVTVTTDAPAFVVYDVFTYNTPLGMWQPYGNGQTFSPTPNIILTGLFSGNYKVRTYNGLGGIADSITHLLDQPQPLTLVNSSLTPVTCFNGSDGTATLSLQGGTMPYTYSWSDGQTTATATGLSAGNYSCIISDLNSCSSPSNPIIVNITQPSSGLNNSTAPYTQFNVDCFGDSTGSVILNPFGGTQPYFYSWFGLPIDHPDSISDQITNVPAGTYQVIVTDANGCTESSSNSLVNDTSNYTISQPSAPLSVLENTVDVICRGGSTGSIVLNVSGGTAPSGAYSYLWGGGQTTQSINNISAGIFNYTVTDAKGCTFSDTVEIQQPLTFLTSSTGSNPALCFATQTGSISVNVSGGVSPYLYVWSNGATTSSYNNVYAGTYTVSITDSLGCNISDLVTVLEPTQISNFFSGDSISCPFGNDGMLMSNASGGTPPFNYTWSSPNPNFNLSGQNTNLLNDSTIDQLHLGSYTVVIDDDNLCSSSHTYLLGSPDQINISASITDVECYGDNSGTIDVNVIGATPPYTYSWDNGQTTSSISSLNSGTYIVTVQDDEGCYGPNGNATVSFDVIELASAPVSVSAIITDVICNGDANGSASLTPSGGTAPYTYLWNTGETVSSLGNLSVGQYTVLVEDAYLCPHTVTFNIDEPTPLTLVESYTDPQCYGYSDGTANVVASGANPPYTYLWSTGHTGPSVNGLSPGPISVTVTDNSGQCNASVFFQIGEPSPIVVSVTTIDNLCYGYSTGSANSQVSDPGNAPFSYLWSTGETTPNIVTLSAGTYDLIVTNNNGCQQNEFFLNGGFSTTTSFDISEPNPLALNPTISPISVTGANDGSVSVSPTGGLAPYSYSWTYSASSSFLNTNSTINNLSPGLYYLQVTDAAGCLQLDTFLFNEPNCNLTINSTYLPPLCHDDNAELFQWNVTGGVAPYVSELIDNNGTFWYGPNSGSNPITFNNSLPPGIYTLNVSDQAGCLQTMNLTIVAPDSITIEFNANNLSCFGNSSGSLSAIASGGTPGSGIPYTYLWSPNNQTSFNINNLFAGTYSVIVTDDNNCQKQESYTLTQPNQLLIDSMTSSYISCNPGVDGQATVYASGGIQPYSYLWTIPNSGIPQTTQTASNLSLAGVYSVQVTDSNGCIILDNINVNNAPNLILTDSVIQPLCYNDTNGMIYALASGGTSPYTYNWSINGQPGSYSSNDFIANLSPAIYTVVVEDTYGCIEQFSEQIINPSPLNISLSPINVSLNGANDGSISSVISGGTGPGTYSYLWYGPNGFTSTLSNISNLYAGIYTLVVLDGNGCATTIIQDINEPACNLNFDTTVTVIAQPLCFQQSGSISWMANGGGISLSTTITDNVTGTVYYSLSTSPNQIYSHSLFDGSYSLQVTDEYGCTDILNFIISSPNPLTANVVTDSVSCFGGNDGSMLIQAIGGTPPYYPNYGTSPITGTPINQNQLTQGTYTVSLTDDNGCTSFPSSFSVQIFEPAQLSVSYTTSPVTCYGGVDGEISLTVNGGTGPYTYNWTPPSGSPAIPSTPIVSGLTANTYFVDVNDVNGCSTNPNITTINVPGPQNNLNININVSDAQCFGASNGSAQAFPTGGTAPYSYEWSDGQTSQLASGLSSGSYTCIVTDANGCINSALAIVGEPNAIDINLSTVDVSCNGLNDGYAVVNPTGGSGTGFSVLWSIVNPNSFPPTGYTSLSVSNISVGQYFVTVTDFSLPGCDVVEDVIITQPNILQITPNLEQIVSCYQGSDGSLSVDVIGGNSPYSYTWSSLSNNSVATTSLASNLSSQMYYIDVVDSNGCSISDSIFLGSNSQLIPNLTFDNVSCYGGSDGIAYANPTGGTGPYSYIWSPTGSTFSSTSGLNANTTYSVQITDDNSCPPVNAYFTVPQPDSIFISVVIDSVSCFMGSDGMISIDSISGGVGPYTYLWSNGQATDTTSNLTAGNYSLIVTDALGCVDSSYSYTVNEPTQVVADITVNTNFNGSNISCFGASDGELTASAFGGTGTYSYLWLTGQTTSNITGLTAGIYSVTVSDMYGCSGDAQITLENPDTIHFNYSISNYNGNNISCYNENDGSVDVHINGGSGINFSSVIWTDINGNLLNPSNIVNDTTLIDLYAGTYFISVSDFNGCTSSSSITLTEPNPISLSFSIDSVTCFGGNDGAAIVNVSGGTSPYSISWSTGSVNDSIFGLDGISNYLVQVSDTNSCPFVVGTISIPQPNQIQTTEIITLPTCYGQNNGQIIIDSIWGGTGPYTYLWNDSLASTGTILPNLNSGEYICTITDALLCSEDILFLVDTVFTVVASASILSNYNGTDVQCYGDTNAIIVGSATGGTPPYTFNWTSGHTTDTVYNVGATYPSIYGSYTVVVTDSNGCYDHSTAQVHNPDSISATILASNYNGYAISCDGLNDGSAAAVISGGNGIDYNTLLWNTGDTSIALDSLTIGTYSYTVEDNNGCSADAQITLSSSPLMQLSLSSDSLSCFGDSNATAYIDILTNGISPFSYLWNNGQVTADATNLISGMYSLTITDDNNCSVSSLVDVFQPDSLISNLSITSSYNGYDVSCFGSLDASINVATSGGVSPYLYSLDSIYFSNTSNYNNLGEGVFNLITRDNNNCVINSHITINSPDELLANFNIIADPTCNGINDGILTSLTSGGTGIYSYDWSNNGSTTNIINSLSVGMYSVVISDNNGCSISDSIELHPVFVLNSNITTTQVSCTGGSDGSANIIMLGGSSPYIYQWSNGQNTSNINGLSAGNYNLIVTDSSGCILTDSIEITESNTALAFTSNISHLTCFEDNSGSISSLVSGGAGGYIYDWSTGDTASSISNLDAGTYILSVTDMVGCIVTDTFVVTEPLELTYILTSNDISCFGLSDGYTDLIVNGGTMPYSFSWTGPGNYTSIDSTINYLGEGMYHLIVTDANGCFVSDSTFVGEPSPLTTVVSHSDPLCHNSLDGSIHIYVEGGISPYTSNYGLLNPTSVLADSIIYQNLASGSNTLSVFDANNCENTYTVTLINPLELVIGNIQTNDPSCHNYSDGSASIEVVGGTLPYVYQLFDNDNNVLTGSSNTNSLSYGSYTYLVTDVNGCDDTLTFAINNPDEISINPLSVTNVNCFGENTGNLEVSVSNNSGSYQIVWMPSQFNTNSEVINDLIAGKYEAVVIDELGCTKVDSFFIEENDQIEVDLSTLNSSCKLNADGQIVFDNIMGGVGPYNIYNNSVLVASDILNSYAIESLINTSEINAYNIVVSDNYNCQYSTTVDIGFDGGYGCINEPVVITPNYDNYNDEWIPILDLDIEIEVEILNRWGQKEFYYSGNSLAFRWNGLANWGGERELPSSDYYYIIKFNNDNYPAKTGVITLIR